MKILLLSAYDAASHRIWRQGLVKIFAEYQWTILTLPARHFSWRIRGNSLTWAFSKREVLTRPYDLVITTSMTDLATLRGLVSQLTEVPSLVYFHENQFAYPERKHAHSRVEQKIVTLYTALAADWVVFNSEFNRQTFLVGARTLLNRMPDGVPHGIVDSILERSDVVPVALDDCWFQEGLGAGKDDPFTLLWNHRWEYDKAPERFFNAMLKLKAAGIDFRVHVIGQQFRERPAVFDEILPLLRTEIIEFGTVLDADQYRRILPQCHAGISTALHDFQGLAILEAVACGCVPVVPDRLAYREMLSPEFRFPSHPDDPEREIEALAGRLVALAEQHRQGRLAAPPDISHLSLQNLKPSYQSAFDKALKNHRESSDPRSVASRDTQSPGRRNKPLYYT